MRGVQNKKENSVWGVSIFSGTAHYENQPIKIKQLWVVELPILMFVLVTPLLIILGFDWSCDMEAMIFPSCHLKSFQKVIMKLCTSGIILCIKHCDLVLKIPCWLQRYCPGHPWQTLAFPARDWKTKI